MDSNKVETVIFTIKITDANSGAWYHKYLGKDDTFQCVLTNAQIGFHGPEICFRVLGHYEPVKYIRLWHGTIVAQAIADNKTSLKRYLTE